MLLLAACSKQSDTNYNPTLTGISGSLSRFTIVNNILFCLDGNTLKTFDITNEENPSPLSTITLNTIPETIFSYENYVLLGTPSGMLIYTAAQTPLYLSTYEHVVSCDPVVADNGYAYVTLRAINQCSQNAGVNQLEIVTLANILSPQLVSQVSMAAPYGLGIDGNNLFVADNDSSIVLFDVTQKESPVVKNTLSVSGARDLIPISGLLMIMAEKKLIQYNYSDANNIQLVSETNL